MAATHDVVQVGHAATTQDPAEMEEFNLFTDYLGLFNLVKSFSNFKAPEEINCDFREENRERRASLGSIGSECSSSNSADSAEVADIYYTAYGQGVSAFKQAFTEPVEELKNESTPLPSSLLLERNQNTVKKPQVKSAWTLVVYMSTYNFIYH